ncbi:MAG: hypothetical protein GYB67_12975, partial [Chloroflexi bacterium]|nr:hypothetical protein [Chloroflexota bacterium]
MGKQIYCITTADSPLDLAVAGANLEVITVGDLVAVVSETDATRIRPSRVNMSAH